VDLALGAPPPERHLGEIDVGGIVLDEEDVAGPHAHDHEIEKVDEPGTFE
jgi:hypothetical protein